MRRIAFSLLIMFLTITLLSGFTEKGLAATNNITVQQQNTIKADSISKDEPQIVPKSEYPIQGYGISPDGVVTFDDKYFGYLHYEIEANTRKYAGQKVVITGFVYKNSDFKNNEFKVARYLPSNCADDAYVLGLMCRTENATDFKRDEWVTVKGTLIVTIYTDPRTKFEYEEVYLQPESIEKIPMRPDYSLWFKLTTINQK